MGVLDILRQEKKYLLNYIEVEQLKYILDQVLVRDTFDITKKGYLVRSLYFDTPDDTDFREKSDGLRDRKKIRLRTYDTEADSAKLELKEKQGDFQRKRSLLLTRREVEEIIEGRYNCLTKREDKFAWEMYTIMEEKLYRPRCIVEYDRMAWIVPENDIRITLDHEIRGTEASYEFFSKDTMFYPVSEIGMTTLEVKFNGFLLSYVKDLLERHGAAQISASKYCMARNISMGGIE